MSKTFFITGIGTEVGKTVVSAIVTQAMQADYWKPIQAGDLDNSDTHKVKRLVDNDESYFHQNAYSLKTPMSPHAAAKIDELEISLDKITRPVTKKDLVIEGAGGLLVPMNEKNTILDLINKEDVIILCSRHYLGSINHTLLSIEALKGRGFKKIGIIFSGPETPSTESIIETIGKVTIIGRVDEEPYFDRMVINEYAEKFREKLCKI